VATFTVSITNTSGITITNLTATSNVLPACDIASTTLPPFSNISNLCTIVTNDDITHTVAITGTSMFGTLVTESDTSLVDVIHPDVAITQFPPTVKPGTNVEIEILVENLGDAPLTITDIDASGCDTLLDGPMGDLFTDGVVDVGEIWTYTCIVNEVPELFMNELSVTATVPGGFVVNDFRKVTSQPITYFIYLPVVQFDCDSQIFVVCIE
jgi:hypothetical protein